MIFFVDDVPDQALEQRAFSHFQAGCFSDLLPSYHQTCFWLKAANQESKVVFQWLLAISPSNYLHPPQNPMVRSLDKHLKVIHGPSFAEGLKPTDLEDIAGGALKWIARYVEEHNMLSVTIVLSPLVTREELQLWARVGHECGFNVIDSHTYALDLYNLSEDQLFHAIKPDRRTKIRKAEKAGLVVEEISKRHQLVDYIQMRMETIRRNGTSPVPAEHFFDTFDALAEKGVMKVFVCRHGDRMCAGQVAFRWNDYLNLSGVSISDYMLRNKLPANDFLQWNVICWAQSHNVRFVDFVGAQPNSADPKIRAIDAFKSRWGTQLHESLVLSKTGSRFRNFVNRALYKLVC